jgi:hypothetical protein
MPVVAYLTIHSSVVAGSRSNLCERQCHSRNGRSSPSNARIKERVVIAGLIRKPVEDDGITKACDNCIYFLARREWCDLPELNIPVDPDWFCDLWRV